MTFIPVNLVVNDSLGEDPLSPDDLPHTYTYNASGQIVTDTVTNGVKTWVKTFSYTNGQLTSETAWVV